jgi:hypothetical protein
MSLALAHSGGRLERLLVGLAWVLALALPFESIRPLLRLPFLEFTNLEMVLAFTAVVWLFVVVHDAAARARIRPLFGPVALFAGVLALSALLAPLYRPEALKFAARLASGCFLLLLAATIITSRRRLVSLLWAISLGATVAALLGLLEWAGWGPLAPLWPLFKVAPSRIGGELRLSGSFQFATIAAFYLEMAVPLMLALAVSSSWRAGRGPAMAMAALATVSVILTLTRSGILLLALLYGGLLLLSWRCRQWKPLFVPAAVALLVWSATVIWLFVGSDLFRTRFTTENDLNWYNAVYEAPFFLNLEAGESAEVGIAVFNSGRATWTPAGEQAYALGYRWLDGSGRPLAETGHWEAALPHEVRPGESVRITTTITAPPAAGDYAIHWGMLQRHILWFHHRGVPDALTQIQVGAPATPQGSLGMMLTSAPEVPAMPVTVPRRQLWQAAAQMIAERPLLGHGPDNFRRLYGRYLELSEADERIHANNLYLELMATTGLAGTLAFAWLLWFCLNPLARLLFMAPLPPRAAEGSVAAFTTHLLPVALAASLAAFFGHGLSDYFLGFTPAASLFWFVVGLAWANSRLVLEERENR